MPEGDTIFRSAVRLRELLPGAKVVKAQGSPRFVPGTALVDSEFAVVEARGKHLLMHLQDRRVLHSHMGMTGAWHIYQAGEPWRKAPQRASLVMQVQRDTDAKPWTVVCFSPKQLELLTATQLRRHAYLQRLGPDLMTAEPDWDAILQRFRVHRLTPIGEAVMNQTIVSGIGNVYKSEALFLTKVDPFRAVGDFEDPVILEVVHTAHSLMRQNRRGGPRKTRIAADGDILWVYGRSGEPCLRCGTRIQMRRQGDLGRSTYWCPDCQVDT